MNKVGIIGAMDIEVEGLKNKMVIHQTVTKAGMIFCQGTLNGTEAVVVKSGIGKVNAAVCTQILIDDFQVKQIINTGIAGSLDARIDIGDVVVSTELVHHDMDAQNFGYEAGQVPQMPVLAFRADQELVSKVKSACEEVNPDIHVFTGRIVSGDQFVADKEKKNQIIDKFHPLCTEMEGAAIGQAAYLNKIPFVVIRAISDKADDSATMDYPAFEQKAAEHCMKLVEKLLEGK